MKLTSKLVFSLNRFRLLKRVQQVFSCPVFGGAGRNRTDDLLLAKQALSQLSYSPF